LSRFAVNWFYRSTAVLTFFFGLTFAGCSSVPDWQSVVGSNAYVSEVVQGVPFRHQVFLHRSTQPVDVLHIYLEGDGLPWVTPTRISRDPTPRDALMLRLMSLDPQPAAYIGRPCYFDMVADDNCDPVLWTDQRYSESVVQSLCAAARSVGHELQAARFRLFGHSGGGVLAVLMARCLDGVEVVVTLGANLDTDAWIRLHGYTPLLGSLNPATADPQSDPVTGLHFYGTADDVVPQHTAERYFAVGPQAQPIRVPGAGHIDCWQVLWPEILAWTDRVVAGDVAGGPELACED
jgi:pimeloyl-ACP methyl ester carboxylesterase